MDLKIIQSLLERVQNPQKCWKTKEFVGAEGFFRRTTDSLTVQDKQGTREQLSLNKKTAADHSGNNTVLRIKHMSGAGPTFCRT